MAIKTEALGVSPISQGPDHNHDPDWAPVPSDTQQAEPIAAAETPSRPALAPDVELVGELQGSGFRDRQWLIQRNGRFIQVSELLYRVAEQANGEHTVAEIAARVTDATDWAVRADHVRRLIQAKLLPLGIVALSGTDSAGSGAGAPPRPPDVLTVNVRLKVLGPRLINPVARRLQVLYTPVVLTSLLVAIVLSHAWLYVGHGVAGGLSAVLATPALAVAALVLAILSDIFHEFGHAAALHYGGGRVRGMGAGLYLIYPVFYTDVTDSYRLGRAARVRTDLGGIYFHLLFTLAIMALYALTRLEFLLVVVLLIDLNVLRQLLPFVRLDGYWLLADLTGIRDLFAHMGPFVRSVVPHTGDGGNKLPPLKRWVAVVFVAYIVLTVPFLAALTVLMVTRLPSIVTALGDALQTQTGALAHAQSSGDVPRVVLAGMQMLLLALQFAGVAYMLYRLGRRWIGLGWKWSTPTPARRAAGALAAIGLAVLLAFQWAPQVAVVLAAPPDGVQHVRVTERNHVLTPVGYPQTPPVGGNHSPIWQNCGFYAIPLVNEHAVHSMEHGAVWITYRPDFPKVQIDVLRGLAQRQTYVLVSPYPNLPAPVVASAWGVQLRLDSAQDPRLVQFVRAFRLGPQAPERGGPCAGGIGN